METNNNITKTTERTKYEKKIIALEKDLAEIKKEILTIKKAIRR